MVVAPSSNLRCSASTRLRANSTAVCESLTAARLASRATYFFGGSLETRRNVMAPYVLHFEIMRRAKARGSEEYDFWGVAPENAPDDPWQKISIFKRKFGGREVELVPTLDYIYDHAAYDQFVTSESQSEHGCGDEDLIGCPDD
jgi:lipid II:glycine glycyltransferase (peptidoglycan interpeptide bridge formation enzyme)